MYHVLEIELRKKVEKAKSINWKNREAWEEAIKEIYEIIDERKDYRSQVCQLIETSDKLSAERDKLLAENELLKKELNKFINQ
tara:strand:- start:250 stop:498 length:249 start_codon:yes stop_codon:yes gene_type:complete